MSKRKNAFYYDSTLTPINGGIPAEGENVRVLPNYIASSDVEAIQESTTNQMTVGPDGELVNGGDDQYVPDFKEPWPDNTGFIMAGVIGPENETDSSPSVVGGINSSITSANLTIQYRGGTFDDLRTNARDDTNEIFDHGINFPEQARDEWTAFAWTFDMSDLTNVKSRIAVRTNSFSDTSQRTRAGQFSFTEFDGIKFFGRPNGGSGDAFLPGVREFLFVQTNYTFQDIEAFRDQIAKRHGIIS